MGKGNGSGFKLASAIFLLFFGIYVFNTQIETIFFQLQIPRIDVIRIILQGLLVTLLFSPLLVLLLGKMHKSDLNVESAVQPHFSVMGYIWRFIVCDISYVFLYIIAGAIIFPYIKDFYADAAHMPEPNKILLMQFFRGLVYIVVTLPIIKMTKGRKLETALMVGLQLSILGGIAPLLPPNPYMPAHVRMIHGIEIGISNFMYGAIIGLLFASKASGIVSNMGRTSDGDE